MQLGRTTLFYQSFLVVLSTLIPTISNQCMSHERCPEPHDSHSKCCTELTRNAASTIPAFVEMVTEKSKTITTTQRRPTKTTTLRTAKFSLKVNTTIISCGRQMLDNNKIVGGSETKFGEFPWMAVLLYSKYNHNVCAGSVIQRKFILTAAHCLVGRALFIIGKPYKVRLGEYDLTTDPDCMTNFCAPNAVDIQISRTYPHPKYQSKAKSSFDIGLVKLVDEIVYNDYIQPICFDKTVNFVGEWFYVAGWGRTEQDLSSNRLLKASIHYANITRCQQAYNSINVRDDQICAGGDNGIDSCSGDSGGPLMLLKNSIWSVVGIVSKGPSNCGKNNYPALYTRIDTHLKWLQRKMLSA